MARCELCEREVDALTAHHLTPRQKTKRKRLEAGPTIIICWACHRQIHSLFDNTQLARELNSSQKLMDEPRMAAFLAWVKQQSPARRIRVRGKRQ
ncbi:MAG: HNH endonuclease [Herpetosiphonaceae bacterium]|nr:HNH endonuclease [Herpetosiphonaceae bacterium]